MKTIMWMLIFICCIGFANAEIEHFITDVNIALTNETCKITVEDNQVRTYTPTGTATDVITINLYRDTSCREDELYDYLQDAVWAENESQSYKDKYTNCTIFKSSLQEKYNENMFYKENVTYKEKYVTCNGQLSACSNPKTYKTEYDECVKNKNNSMFWAAIITGGVMYFLFIKKSTPGKPTDALPPSR